MLLFSCYSYGLLLIAVVMVMKVQYGRQTSTTLSLSGLLTTDITVSINTLLAPLVVYSSLEGTLKSMSAST